MASREDIRSAVATPELLLPSSAHDVTDRDAAAFRRVGNGAANGAYRCLFERVMRVQGVRKVLAACDNDGEVLVRVGWLDERKRQLDPWKPEGSSLREAVLHRAVAFGAAVCVLGVRPNAIRTLRDDLGYGMLFRPLPFAVPVESDAVVVDCDLELRVPVCTVQSKLNAVGPLVETDIVHAGGEIDSVRLVFGLGYGITR